jgi:hypothetical protein
MLTLAPYEESQVDKVHPYPISKITLRRRICGRPPERKRFLGWSDTWSDAAICPASDAAMQCREPVWEFADRIQITH